MLLSSQLHSTWLLIDTTGQGCHLGLMHQGQLIQQSDMQPQSHTKRILPMIESLLVQVKLSPKDIQAIIYTQGPGSFTGVRVGVSVVQGLAFSLSIPTLGISTLMALAWQGSLATDQRKIGVLIDARMSQIYWAVYDFAEGALPLVNDCLTNLEQITAAGLPSCISGDVHLLPNADVNTESMLYSPQTSVDIKALFNLAEIGISKGFLAWDQVIPLPIYLRNDVACLPKK